MLNKIGILVTAACLTVVSLPSYAWRAAGAGGAGVARGANGGAAAWNRNTGNAVVRGPNGNTAAVHGGGYHGGGVYRAPVPAYGYRGGAYYNNNGYSSGQVAAAGVAGLAVGAMVGSAAAKSNQSSNTTVIVQQPAMAIGTNLNNLPSGCSSINVNGIQYFQCSSSWMRSYGNYYQVVPTPY